MAWGAEARRFALFGALVAIASSVPYVVAAWFGPAGMERAWTFWYSQDASQYAAAMREAHGTGSWLVHDHLTAEAHAPILLYPLYTALGKIAAATGATDGVVFEGMVWIGRLALALSLWSFTTTMLGRTRERTLALVLALASFGLMGWALPLHLAMGLQGGRGIEGDPSTFLEFNTFGVFLSAPHLMLGLGLTLLCAPAYLHWTRTQHRAWLLTLAVLVLALSLVHPFNAPVLVVVLWITALLNRSDRAGLAGALAASIAAAPMTLHNLLLFEFDPFWSATYGLQNAMPMPGPWVLPLTFGLPLVAAPLGWWGARAWPADQRRLLLAWIMVGLACAYLPVAYQRRFAFGVQPALAVYGALGMVVAQRWMGRRGWRGRRRLVNYTLAFGVALTPVIVYATLVSAAATNWPLPVYQWTAPEADAARWLAADGTVTDVVMASSRYGNTLAGVFDGRVVAGHPVATRASADKEALVKAFYGDQTSLPDKARLLAECGATLVVVGPAERALGGTTIAEVPGLSLAYDSHGVQWYRFDGTDH